MLVERKLTLLCKIAEVRYLPITPPTLVGGGSLTTRFEVQAPWEPPSFSEAVGSTVGSNSKSQPGVGP